MAVATCPKPETLAAFARGDLVAEELAAVAGHVGTCEACCRALQLVPEDSLAHLARAAAAVPPTIPSVCQTGTREPTARKDQIPAGFADHPRYRIIGELGAGGMGTVYKAEDLLMGRVIAIKVVSAHLTAKTGAVERFRREIRATAQLKDHHIVVVHDAGEAGGAHFLVMEFVEGVSLDRLVAKKGPLPVHMACLFARQAALGLQHAADKGMVHRDIKPQNLMVTKKGQVKILDFGLARFARADEEEEAPGGRLPFGAGKATADNAVTNPNLVMGTPDYLSPEQAKNSHEVDPRSDIYSLGCTLHFLLTGQAPFKDASSLIDKLLAHTHDAPTPIRQLRPEVPQGLADVLANMMAKKPDDRYQTAAEAAAALYPFTRATASEPAFEIVEAVLVAPAPSAPARPVAPAAQQAYEATPEPGGPTLADAQRPKHPKKKKKQRSWWQRRKWAVMGAGAALMLFLGAAVAVSKKPHQPYADPAENAKENAKADPAPTPPPEKANVQPKGEPPKVGGHRPQKTNPWTTATVIEPPKPKPKVLFVLPSHDVWLPDFVPVARRLEERGATVVTASTDGGSSKPDPRHAGEPVPIDKHFTATMSLSEYSAIVFCGAHIEEYMGPGRGSAAAEKVIQQMHQAKKPIAGIGLGEGAIAAHKVLRGKRVAHCDWLLKKHPFFPWDKMAVTWEEKGVVVDGNIITSPGGKEHAHAFADAILKAVHGK